LIGVVLSILIGMLLAALLDSLLLETGKAKVMEAPVIPPAPGQ
jgi:hypothetical protein